MQPQQPHDYGFIMQDAPKPKKTLLPSSGGLIGKVIFITAGILIFIILFSVISNLISPKTNFSGFITVAQDQQEINHVLAQAIEQTGLTEPTKEFILTAQLGITNDQGKVLTYLSGNNVKVKPKVLNLKLSTKIDNELGAATTPEAYDIVLRDTVKQQLGTYGQDLAKERTHFKGKKGQTILDNAIHDNKLLLQKLDAR